MKSEKVKSDANCIWQRYQEAEWWTTGFLFHLHGWMKMGPFLCYLNWLYDVGLLLAAMYAVGLCAKAGKIERWREADHSFNFGKTTKNYLSAISIIQLKSLKKNHLVLWFKKKRQHNFKKKKKKKAYYRIPVSKTDKRPTKMEFLWLQI